jgi:P-type Ca2+ transporter type 2C
LGSETTIALEPHAFAETIVAVIESLDANPEKGLTTSEARARLRRDGTHKLTETTTPAWWRKLLEQFNQLVIWILIAATILSGILGDWLRASRHGQKDS